MFAVGQDRIDPRARATYRSDPVHGVLAAENRERTGTGGQLKNAVRSAVQDPPDGRVILVLAVPAPGIVVEVAARVGLLVHQGDGEFAVVEVPAELIAVVED